MSKKPYNCPCCGLVYIKQIREYNSSISPEWYHCINCEHIWKHYAVMGYGENDHVEFLPDDFDPDLVFDDAMDEIGDWSKYDIDTKGAVVELRTYIPESNLLKRLWNVFWHGHPDQIIVRFILTEREDASTLFNRTD